MGGAYLGVNFSENLGNFPIIYAIKINASVSAVEFHKIHLHTVFATDAQVDVT